MTAMIALLNMSSKSLCPAVNYRPYYFFCVTVRIIFFYVLLRIFPENIIYCIFLHKRLKGFGQLFSPLQDEHIVMWFSAVYGLKTSVTEINLLRSQCNEWKKNVLEYECRPFL